MASGSKTGYGDALIGQTVHHYTILEKIGEGGMGVVYRAEDTKLHRTVALKFLPPHAVGDEEAKLRFFQEARSVAALDHPNIGTVHEIDEFENNTFIAMAYVEGETLTEKILTGSMSLHEILKFTTQIAGGLHEAHAKDIIHRDIKPSNIKFTQSGQPKILDFGLARSAGQADLTKSGTLIGTVAYMSPEQARSDVVDHRTDIWSLGVVLYEMLSGRRPFDADYEQSIIYSICNEDYPRLSCVVDTVPPEVESVVDRCLRKDPRERYQEAREISEDLRRIDSGERTSVTASPRTRKRPHLSQKMKIGILGILAILLALWAGPRLSSIPLFSAWFKQVRIPNERHLAVLPFGNIGNDPANQPLCDGLMEFLTSKLTQLEQFQGALWVVPSIEILGRNIQSVSEAQRAFAVNLTVTGSMQRQGDEVQLNMNLVDANTLRQLTSTVIEGHLGDVSLLQHEVVVRLAEMLEVELRPPMLEVLAAGATTVARAHDLYLQGKGYLQRYEEPENIDTSIGLFSRATNEDPTYALAFAGLGEAYWRKYRITEEKQYVETAIRYCRRALELDDQLAPGHITLGLIHGGTGRYADAENDFSRALELDPVNADAFLGLARAYETQGEYEKAEATYKKAIELRPSYWAGYNKLGFFYYKRGRYKDALAQFHEVVNLTPYNLMGHNNLGGIYYLVERWEDSRRMFERSLEIKPNYQAYSNLGALNFLDARYDTAAGMYRKALELDDRDYRVWGGLGSSNHWIPGKQTEAKAAFQRAAEGAEKRLRINPNDGEVLCHLAAYYQALGRSTESRELLGEALKLAPNDLEVMFQAGHTFEILGDREDALKWLVKALKGGYSKAEIEHAPGLRELRDDPRFEQMLNAKS